MKEHDIQNKIRLEFGQHTGGILFRANVGQAWTGSRIERHMDGSITIYEARPFNTGLPQGFSDLFGVLPGGRAVFLEIKAPGSKPTKDQINFIEQMQYAGAAAGVARSIEDVVQICKERK
ncbi:MAG: VRR-NUC domain-containing protein [Desulfitobacteriaceae bacterium]